jgi:hypothetical protein
MVVCCQNILRYKILTARSRSDDSFLSVQIGIWSIRFWSNGSRSNDWDMLTASRDSWYFSQFLKVLCLWICNNTVPILYKFVWWKLVAWNFEVFLLKIWKLTQLFIDRMENHHSKTVDISAQIWLMKVFF